MSWNWSDVLATLLVAALVVQVSSGFGIDALVTGSGVLLASFVASIVARRILALVSRTGPGPRVSHLIGLS